MNLFQDGLKSWLKRGTPERGVYQCFDFPMVLATDLGLLRKENQDRVAALYTGKNSVNPVFVVAVADGMGGMREGAECANTAVSSFFFSLVQNRHLDTAARAVVALEYANDEVYKIYKGHGGATLSAVIFDIDSNAHTVHIGDSRIYAFGINKQVERHTVDDTLAEAVGGTARELLQFVGMGPEIQVSTKMLSTVQPFCIVTTDGIHSLEEKTFFDILNNSHDPKQISERLSALSRWCGGVDNASSAIFNLASIKDSIKTSFVSEIKVWDPYSELTFMWIKEEQPQLVKVPKANELQNSPAEIEEPEFKKSKTANSDSEKKRKTSPRKQKKPNEAGKAQLDIEIDIEDSLGGADSDSSQ